MNDKWKNFNKCVSSKILCQCWLLAFAAGLIKVFKNIFRAKKLRCKCDKNTRVCFRIHLMVKKKVHIRFFAEIFRDICLKTEKHSHSLECYSEHFLDSYMIEKKLCFKIALSNQLANSPACLRQKRINLWKARWNLSKSLNLTYTNR